MLRRAFLGLTGKAALSLSFIPITTPGVEDPESGAKDESLRKALIADLERQIPKTMEESLVPGLSIAVIHDGKMVWERGFGVKNAASKVPVDRETLFEAAS